VFQDSTFSKSSLSVTTAKLIRFLVRYEPKQNGRTDGRTGTIR